MTDSEIAVWVSHSEMKVYGYKVVLGLFF